MTLACFMVCGSGMVKTFFNSSLFMLPLPQLFFPKSSSWSRRWLVVVVVVWNVDCSDFQRTQTSEWVPPFIQIKYYPSPLFSFIFSCLPGLLCSFHCKSSWSDTSFSGLCKILPDLLSLCNEVILRTTASVLSVLILELASLTQQQLLEKVKALQNLAYELGREEGNSCLSYYFSTCSTRTSKYCFF